MTLQRITCPSCGSSRFEHQPDGTLMCAACGTQFGSPQEPIQCPSCGTENPPQARKCMNCGLTLGRICPMCNYHNPPGADHCQQCATPLDQLSAMLTRTGSGKSQSDKLMKDVLVRSKAEDSVYMHQQRAKLEEEERQRMQAFQAQRKEAVKQQQMIMIITVAAVVVALIILAVLVINSR